MLKKLVFPAFVVLFLVSCGLSPTPHGCNWGEDWEGAPPRPVVRVACVGDSITFGMGTAEGMSYPSQLQTLLGSGYKVGNFGVSARTLLRKGDYPWWNEPQFRASQDFAPNVVVIMLGTNDTKPHNWEHIDEFYSDYSDLLDLFLNLPTHPRVYVCRPCPVPVPGHWGINETNIQAEIPLIDQLAAEKGLSVIDMHAALEEHHDLLPDRVHPNTAGAKLMAEAAYVAITGQGVPPSVNSYFSDHAVLQRGVKVPVWGTAPDGEKITVCFAGQKKKTVAKDGRWSVELKPMKACAEPRNLTVSNGRGVRVIRDVLVGDVWVASGQSNMERQLGPRSGQKEIVGWKEAVASANYPLIRQYYIPLQNSMVPEEDGHGSWSVCSPETAPNFCGVGFFFIRDVYEVQKVPMAMIHTAWGGTPAEAWTSLEKLKTVPSYAGFARTVEELAKDPSTLSSLRAKWLEEFDAGTQGAWWKETVAADGWYSVAKLGDLEDMGMKSFDGVAWFRKEIELPANFSGCEATLQLGAIDDCDSTWVNGQLIGETDGWNTQRGYKVPAGVLKAGRNVIAIRVIDTGGGGGWGATSSEMNLAVVGADASEKVMLSENWQVQVGTPLTRGASFFIRGKLNQNSPATLYNAMIHPILPMPIKGVVWYQGESNNDRAKDYEELFASMIQDWRARWNCGDFPFLYVQIAPHHLMSPELRESQRLVLERESNTAMAVTVDVGDAGDIHPARKEPVGQRLALAARALAYGEDMEYSGPLYESMGVDMSSAVITFSHCGSGLEAMGGELRGFEVAGADGKFVSATAAIKGDGVMVFSPEVDRPAAVRYGWSNVPDINLFNKEGLPASPFWATPAKAR